MATNKINKEQIVGGILSGGKSSRMGQPKDRILLSDSRSMLEHVLDTMFKVCAKVVVAGPTPPGMRCDPKQVIFVKDNKIEAGPLGGIEAILASGIADGYLIAACDQPYLTSELLLELAPDDKSMPCFFDLPGSPIIQPLPGYYPANWLDDIREALSKKRNALKALIADSDVVLKKIAPEKAACLKSINTAEDLTLALPNRLT
ncbi:MAG: molybdenum cofactor guanylyltransferase [Candidatus Obscuribacterales bacterium]|nr:molybdenum cofactor guanylyltransferase [Candidatus Obscuribacterales bacterium]